MKYDIITFLLLLKYIWRVIAKFVRSTKSGPKMWFTIKNGFHQSKKYLNNLL